MSHTFCNTVKQIKPTTCANTQKHTLLVMPPNATTKLNLSGQEQTHCFLVLSIDTQTEKNNMYDQLYI